MNKCTFAVGIHGATIESIYAAKDHKGRVLVNKETGEVDITVLFRGDMGMTGETTIRFSEKTQYITDNLIKACKLTNEGMPVHVKELIGKKVWIYVKGYWRIGEHPGIDPPMMTEIIPGRYSQHFGPKPAYIGAPTEKNEVPSGIFVEFADIDKTASVVNLQERGFGDD